MIAFDICARSISYLLCLISEFSSIIKMKTLLALPSMCHITSIFSKHHVQFLGTSAPGLTWNFSSCYPAVWIDLVHCGMACDPWKYIVSWFSSPTQVLKWPIFPHLCWTDLWFLSHRIKILLPLERTGQSGSGLSIRFQCHPPSCAVSWISVFFFF